MLTPPPPYSLRSMTVDDIDVVRAIDRLSFPTPVKAGLYVHELTQNKMAHYQVLTAPEKIIGYTGFWMLADEAHVITIATHPKWRGRGLGELLLLNLLYLAGEAGATLATLEVRRSNTVAQALYQKYAFDVVGERPRYYQDTGDDALIMTVMLKDDYYARTLAQAKKALFMRLRGAD
ncbi:MAG: ribosomal protein S18-alanine N-acetyltransferase [Anaerolinea sp.]|nr:ribosomal protein S18-alanine N-acetyltransferase [Anaerolinea sp.]